MTIKPAANQLSLFFEQGISRRFKSLRRAAADMVYRHGLDRCAIAADSAPSNLSASLVDRQAGDKSARRFDVDDLERIIEETGDYTPIYYLIDRFLRDDQARKEEAISRLSMMLPELNELLERAGLSAKAARR